MMLWLPSDLLITRQDDADRIERQAWFFFAIHTVALFQLDADLESRPGIEFPAFGLFGRFNRPVLFWRDGSVVVKYADDEHLEDLRLIARRLSADLVEPGGP